MRIGEQPYQCLPLMNHYGCKESNDSESESAKPHVDLSVAFLLTFALPVVCFVRVSDLLSPTGLISYSPAVALGSVYHCVGAASRLRVVIDFRIDAWGTLFSSSSDAFSKRWCD